MKQTRIGIITGRALGNGPKRMLTYLMLTTFVCVYGFSWGTVNSAAMARRVARSGENASLVTGPASPIKGWSSSRGWSRSVNPTT
jgi:hypothetical protein